MTFCGWPPTVPLVALDAAGVLLDGAAELELLVAADDVALDDGPDVWFSLEQPAALATIVDAPTAINNSRFYQSLLFGSDSR